MESAKFCSFEYIFSCVVCGFPRAAWTMQKFPATWTRRRAVSTQSCSRSRVGWISHIIYSLSSFHIDSVKNTVKQSRYPFIIAAIYIVWQGVAFPFTERRGMAWEGTQATGPVHGRQFPFGRRWQGTLLRGFLDRFWLLVHIGASNQKSLAFFEKIVILFFVAWRNCDAQWRWMPYGNARGRNAVHWEHHSGLRCRWINPQADPFKTAFRKLI